MQGIYGIRINGKWYIGSSTDIKRRIGTHMQSLAIGRHPFTEMQRDFRKAKPENISSIVLAEIPKKHMLLYYENYYIGKYDSIETGYNTKIETSCREGITSNDIKKVVTESLEEIVSEMVRQDIKAFGMMIGNKKMMDKTANKVIDKIIKSII